MHTALHLLNRSEVLQGLALNLFAVGVWIPNASLQGICCHYRQKECAVFFHGVVMSVRWYIPLRVGHLRLNPKSFRQNKLSANSAGSRPSAHWQRKSCAFAGDVLSSSADEQCPHGWLYSH